MTREEALRIVSRIDRNILTDEECYVADNIFELVEPSLPSNLDEAAEEYAPDFSNDIASKAAVNAVRDAFKAGAEWVIGQLEEE